MDEPFTLYKLIILYMLNRVSFPMTTAQVGDFILGRNYTNFLTLNQAISDLKEGGFIKTHQTSNRTFMKLTKEGTDTLGFFRNRINDAIIEDVEKFLKENEYSIRDAYSVQSSYYKNDRNSYDVNLLLLDGADKLIDLTMTIPSEELAKTICDNFQAKNAEIYKSLVTALF